MIDAYASLRHYAEHLHPVWAQLPPEVRGTFWSQDNGQPWGQHLDGKRDHTRLVLVASLRDAIAMDPSPLVLVEHGAGQTYLGAGLGHGSYPGGKGHDRVRLFLCPNQHVAELWAASYPATPAVVVGCPQLDSWHQVDGTYYGNMTAQCSVDGCDKPTDARGWCKKHYTRWARHGDVGTSHRPDLGLTPVERFYSYVDQAGPVPAERPDLGACWLWTGGTVKGYGEFWDGKVVYAHRWSYEHHVGPIPAGHDVDHLCFQPLCVRPSHLEPVTHGENMRRMWARKRAARAAAVPVVAMTFHWDCGLVPETRSAWRHYDRTLPALAHDPRWQLLGHGHPRLWPTIRKRWAQLGVEPEPDLAGVLDRADLLVGDNTSALYEFASTGRPVVCLNQPGYRRDVHHGLRFWSHPPGLQCDQPGQLAATIERALADPPVARAIRALAVQRAYAHTDGRAAERAAAAIMEAHR